jgi:hypothetical protein
MLAMLCACSQPSSFSGRVQFQVPMEPDQWEGFLAKANELLPTEMYEGKQGEIVRTPGAPPILYIEKTSRDERYKVIVAQRTGRKSLSVILYTSDAKPADKDWHEEAKRLEANLRSRFGDALSVNYGAIKEIPY